jgi:hypothetical protein
MTKENIQFRDVTSSENASLTVSFAGRLDVAGIVLQRKMLPIIRTKQQTMHSKLI